MFDALRAEIYIYSDLTPIVNTRDGPSPFHIPEHQRPADIAAMLNSEKFSDVSLICGNDKYFGHRSILAARSEVFSDMLLEYNNIQATAEIEITDLKPAVFYEVLKYMYGDAIYSLPELADELMTAASTYALPGLRLICERSIIVNLKVENAIDSMILAEKHRSDGLKRKILAFIVINAREVVQTPGYRKVVENQQTQMLAEVIRVLAENQ